MEVEARGRLAKISIVPKQLNDSIKILATQWDVFEGKIATIEKKLKIAEHKMKEVGQFVHPWTLVEQRIYELEQRANPFYLSDAERDFMAKAGHQAEPQTSPDQTPQQVGTQTQPQSPRK